MKIHHHRQHYHLGHFCQIHHHEKDGGDDDLKDVPRGCVAVMVGQGREQQRFVIPVIYVNHPLFLSLLKEAEEEYGFSHNGPITIPCHVAEFRQVEGIIHKETTSQHHHHNHLHSGCFKIRA
ncbi:unnamed protein product [Cuscuta campestris]|uniref:Auxin-responsive protein SAUR32 n=1 Tax=Cuscuta campestris TaxID=132261 RepID=A0A484KQB7_9ASTE|nr:unnamed protein product [Cuscuta campestris]